MRLIDADELKQAIPETKVDVFENCGSCTCLTDEQVKELIDDAPTIEALKEQQPKKGTWKVKIRHHPYPDGREYKKFSCSVCGNDVDDHEDSDFCPWCGADMRENETH